MQCYTHRENFAVGLCKNCQKAVCADCANDTGLGLVCSDVCRKEIIECNEINRRSKLIYNIGGKQSKVPPSGIIFYFIFGLLFLGFGLSPMANGDSPEWLIFIMGSAFVIFSVFLYIRTRKLNINC